MNTLLILIEGQTVDRDGNKKRTSQSAGLWAQVERELLFPPRMARFMVCRFNVQGPSVV